MADVNDCPEPTFPTKRIPDVSTHDSIDEPKKQKLENPESNSDANVKKTPEIQEPLTEMQKDKGKQELVEEEEETKREVVVEEEEIERLNGKAEIDRKGKGILIEEEEDDDDDDVDDHDDDDEDDDSDSNSGSDSDSDSPVVNELSEDSDFVDDPLAEVNLDNILPSRTRRRTIDPGSYLGSDLPEEDDDESDDPDA